MAALSIAIAFFSRLLLVLLFLPFSALDKILDFKGAVAQANEMAPTRTLAVGLILAGLAVEILMPLAILSGVADRAAGLVLAAYCVVTACLWKRFWVPGDFWAGGDSQARALFWDFFKNLAVAGGFLLIAFGASAQTATAIFSHPLGSSHPYQIGGAAP